LQSCAATAALFRDHKLRTALGVSRTIADQNTNVKSCAPSVVAASARPRWGKRPDRARRQGPSRGGLPIWDARPNRQPNWRSPIRPNLQRLCAEKSCT